MKLSILMLLPVLLAPLVGTAAVPDDPLGSSLWGSMVSEFFNDGPVVFDHRVRVKAPEYAEDSLRTPIQISAPDLKNVKQIVVVADLNPITRVLDYYPVRAQPSIGFSFKIEQATPLRAAMRTADGTWHVGGVWIDAQGGGCTAPSAASDSPTLASELGEAEARLWSPDPDSENALARLKVRIVHPMNTGLVANIRAMYLSELAVADTDGDTLARITPYEPVSENPVFTLDLDAAGPVTLSGHDTQGNRINAQVAEVTP